MLTNCTIKNSPPLTVLDSRRPPTLTEPGLALTVTREILFHFLRSGSVQCARGRDKSALCGGPPLPRCVGKLAHRAAKKGKYTPFTKRPKTRLAQIQLICNKRQKRNLSVFRRRPVTLNSKAACGSSVLQFACRASLSKLSDHPMAMELLLEGEQPLSGDRLLEPVTTFTTTTAACCPSLTLPAS
jgi:hypothetical protein